MGFPSYHSGSGNSHKLSIRKGNAKKGESNTDASYGTLNIRTLTQGSIQRDMYI